MCSRWQLIVEKLKKEDNLMLSKWLTWSFCVCSNGLSVIWMNSWKWKHFTYTPTVPRLLVKYIFDSFRKLIVMSEARCWDEKHEALVTEHGHSPDLFGALVFRHSIHTPTSLHHPRASQSYHLSAAFISSFLWGVLGIHTWSRIRYCISDI